MKNEKRPCFNSMAFFQSSILFFHLKPWAVYPAALWSADLVDHGEFKTSITTAFFAQARYIDIVAEADTPIGVVKAGGEDKGIHE